MKIKNPNLLLIILVLLNAAFCLGLCLGIKQDSTPAQAARLLLLCTLSFIGTGTISYLISRSIIKDYIEPIELTAAKLLALESNMTMQDEIQELPNLARKLVNALETAKQRERLIADYASDVLCCLDEQRRFLDLNMQSESIWQYPIISLLASPLDQLIWSDDLEAYLEFFTEAKSLKTDKPFECRIRARSGKLIDMEWQVEWSESSKHLFCLAKDISDRKAKERLKAEITAMVGHDLRAPASSLSFLLQNLQEGTFGALPAEAQEKVGKAGDNVAQMLKLINQLLDAEKLEGGQMEADLKIIPLSELYEGCQDLLGDLALQKNLTLSFPSDSETLAMADFDRSLQILSNLVSNAIKFSPESSKIEILETNEGKTVTISVQDQGPGIAQDKQELIFERFKSISQRTDKSMASSGLGLFIARKLAELQGGTIKLNSKPGQGSCFSFSLKQVGRRELPGYIVQADS